VRDRAVVAGNDLEAVALHFFALALRLLGLRSLRSMDGMGAGGGQCQRDGDQRGQ
jgi:hypothetical protein